MFKLKIILLTNTLCSTYIIIITSTQLGVHCVRERIIADAAFYSSAHIWILHSVASYINITRSELALLAQY